MSKENLERFYELVRQDQTLQKQLADVTSADQFADITVRLGAERGLAFTAEDVKASIESVTARGAELGETELETVAGGGFLVLSKPNLGPFSAPRISASLNPSASYPSGGQSLGVGYC